MRNKESTSMVTQTLVGTRAGKTAYFNPMVHPQTLSWDPGSLAMSLERGESCTCVMDWT